jgi:GT2 family glycosyltransferase
LVQASIIIPSYNRPDLIVRTARSVAVQTVPRGEYEVIVVDDHSTPPVSEAFHGRQLPPGVRIVRCEENLGRAAARNVGVRAARGDVVVMLDDDMEVVRHFLEAHLREHERNPDAVVLGKIEAAPELGGHPFLRYLNSRGPEKVPDGQPVPSKYFVTGNSSVRRSRLEKVGLFDEEFHLYGGEDTELGIRLGKAGCVFLYAPDALAHHLHVVNLDQLCERLEAYGEHALPGMLEKHPELKELLSLDILDPPRWGQEAPARSFRRALFQATLRPASYRLARSLARVTWLGRMLYPVYDYLRAYSYMTGFLKVTTQGGSEREPTGHTSERRGSGTQENDQGAEGGERE